MVFGENTDVFEAHTVIIGANTVVFGANTVLFGENTEVSSHCYWPVAAVHEKCCVSDCFNFALRVITALTHLEIAVILLSLLDLPQWQYTVVNEPDQETIEWFQAQKDTSAVIDELAAV